jgi:hypothetical protein
VVRAARVETEVVAEFRSHVPATSLFVYSDCVERESIANGRLRREVVAIRDVAGSRIEPLPCGS